MKPVFLYILGFNAEAQMHLEESAAWNAFRLDQQKPIPVYMLSIFAALRTFRDKHADNVCGEQT